MSENRKPIYTDVDGGVFTIEVIDTDYGKIPVRKYLHTKSKDMTENHKLRSVYFLATPKQVDQLIEYGYSIIRHVKHKVYEARVTNQQQFIRIAEEFDVHTTMSEDAPVGNIEIETTIAGVDFKGVLDKLDRLSLTTKKPQRFYSTF